jgi:hypothetical protein
VNNNDLNQNTNSNDGINTNPNLNTNSNIGNTQPINQVSSSSVVNDTLVQSNNTATSESSNTNPNNGGVNVISSSSFTISTEVPASMTNIGNNSSDNLKRDTNDIDNEKLKHVEIEYTPPSKAKTILLVLFFVFLLGFIIFLPDIQSMVSKYKAGAYNTVDDTITTGKLECSLNSSTANLDLDYDRVFNFTDSKLEKATFTLVTKGDITLDEATLDELNVKCEQLATNVDSLSGISVSCSYKDGELTEKQVFTYSSVNMDEVDSAFSEAGGVLPTFEYQQDIDEIEKTMNAAGYTCSREKTE